MDSDEHSSDTYAAEQEENTDQAKQLLDNIDTNVFHGESQIVIEYIDDVLDEIKRILDFDDPYWQTKHSSSESPFKFYAKQRKEIRNNISPSKIPHFDMFIATVNDISSCITTMPFIPYAICFLQKKKLYGPTAKFDKI